MNIFFLDQNPTLAAQYQCNKHVVKMILESAQILCTCHHLCNSENIPSKFYRPTHKNHPCSVWTRKFINNYYWLCNHALELCREYNFRFGKTHASLPIILWCYKNRPNIPDFTNEDKIKLSNQLVTTPPLAMPDEYKSDDVVSSYRNYYKFHKMKTIKCDWTKREKPKWL